jgi:hypothetical protein
MSERKTPETDAKAQITFGDRLCAPGTDIVSGDFARRLERQRDAAVEALKATDKHFADYLESIAPFASTEELKTELSQTRSGKLHAVIRAVLAEIEGKS